MHWAIWDLIDFIDMAGRSHDLSCDLAFRSLTYLPQTFAWDDTLVKHFRCETQYRRCSWKIRRVHSHSLKTDRGMTLWISSATSVISTTVTYISHIVRLWCTSVQDNLMIACPWATARKLTHPCRQQRNLSEICSVSLVIIWRVSLGNNTA